MEEGAAPEAVVVVPTFGTPVLSEKLSAAEKQGPAPAAVSAALFVVGAAPWLAVHSLFAEVPLLCRQLSVHRQVGVLIGATVQLSNAAAFLYVAVAPSLQLTVSSTAAGCTVLAILCPVALAFAWKTTAVTFAVAFVAGAEAAVSRPVWFPHFAGLLGASAVRPLTAGVMGGAVLPAVVAAVQQCRGGGDHLFSVRAFFVGASAVSLAAGAAYLYLRRAAQPVGEAHSPLLPGSQGERPLNVHSVRAATPGSRISAEVEWASIGQRSASSILGYDGMATAIADVQPPPGKCPAPGVVTSALVSSCASHFLMPGLLLYLQHDVSRAVWSNLLVAVGTAAGRILAPALHGNCTPPAAAQLALCVYLLFLATGDSGGAVPTDSSDVAGTHLEWWWLSVGLPVALAGVGGGAASAAAAGAARDYIPTHGLVVLTGVSHATQAGAIIGTGACVILAVCGAFTENSL